MPLCMQHTFDWQTFYMFIFLLYIEQLVVSSLYLLLYMKIKMYMLPRNCLCSLFEIQKKMFKLIEKSEKKKVL